MQSVAHLSGRIRSPAGRACCAPTRTTCEPPQPRAFLSTRSSMRLLTIRHFIPVHFLRLYHHLFPFLFCIKRGVALQVPGQHTSAAKGQSGRCGGEGGGSTRWAPPAIIRDHHCVMPSTSSPLDLGPAQQAWEQAPSSTRGSSPVLGGLLPLTSRGSEGQGPLPQNKNGHSCSYYPGRPTGLAIIWHLQTDPEATGTSPDVGLSSFHHPLVHRAGMHRTRPASPWGENHYSRLEGTGIPSTREGWTWAGPGGHRGVPFESRDGSGPLAVDLISVAQLPILPHHAPGTRESSSQSSRRAQGRIKLESKRLNSARPLRKQNARESTSHEEGKATAGPFERPGIAGTHEKVRFELGSEIGAGPCVGG